MTLASITATIGGWPKKRILGIIAVLTLAFLLREHLAPALLFALTNLWLIAPIILIGLLVTAYLTATGSIEILVAAFDGRELRAIALISLIGAILPVCGITVLPLVAGLLAAGVSLAPVMAFLLSSAVTDPEMIAVTAATLGWQFALGKTLSALGIGLLGGGITLMLSQAGNFTQPTRQSALLERLLPASSCDTASTLMWRFWHDPERVKAFRDSAYALVKLVLLWLSLAFVVEYFIKLYLPDDVLSGFVGRDNPLSVPIAAIIGAPLYIDGYAALPFVRGLIDKGMADGAAMAFLIAGGITSAWTAIPVYALFRMPVFLTYIGLAVTGAILSGWAYAFAIV